MHYKTGMHIDIRPFRSDDADYAALKALRDVVFPEYIFTAEEFRRMDERREAHCFFARYVAEADGQVVGMGHFGHMGWQFHPHKFEAAVHVPPSYERRGIGGQIYEHLIAELAAHQPQTLRQQVREDYTAALRFASKRGFVEERRTWESRLDVAAFAPAPFAGHSERVEAGGIAIRTAAELEAADPDFWPKLYALDTALGQDVPNPEPFTPAPFEHWIGWFKDAPSFLPDGMFIASDGGHLVGLSTLWRRAVGPDLDTGLTGVRREYRRRGIALALKLRAIDYARRQGAPMLRTENASTNRPMLSINEALGFAKQPAWITLRKDI